MNKQAYRRQRILERIKQSHQTNEEQRRKALEKIREIRNRLNTSV